MNYGQTSGFPETLGFIRPIGTGALWSRSGRKPFGAFRQPKLSVFGPYTGNQRWNAAFSSTQYVSLFPSESDLEWLISIACLGLLYV